MAGQSHVGAGQSSDLAALLGRFGRLDQALYEEAKLLDVEEHLI